MGRTILGPTERVSSFSRDDLSGFVSEHYAPERMILSAAGAVDHDAIVKEAEKLFAHLTRGNAPQTDTARFVGGERRELKALEQVHFTLALESPHYLHDDIYAAQIFTTAFGGGMSSRLFQEIREKRGLCYSIFAQTGAFADTGMTTIYAGTSADQIAELANLSIDELRRAQDDMSEAEVARARAQLKAGMLMGLESPSSRAERSARMVAIWGRVPDAAEVVEKFDAVSVQDVRNIAAEMAKSPPAVAIYGPGDTAPSLAQISERLVA